MALTPPPPPPAVSGNFGWMILKERKNSGSGWKGKILKEIKKFKKLLGKNFTKYFNVFFYFGTL